MEEAEQEGLVATGLALQRRLDEKRKYGLIPKNGTNIFLEARAALGDFGTGRGLHLHPRLDRYWDFLQRTKTSCYSTGSTGGEQTTLLPTGAVTAAATDQLAASSRHRRRNVGDLHGPAGGEQRRGCFD